MTSPHRRWKTPDMLSDDSLLYIIKRDVKIDQWLCYCAEVSATGKMLTRLKNANGQWGSWCSCGQGVDCGDSVSPLLCFLLLPSTPVGGNLTVDPRAVSQIQTSCFSLNPHHMLRNKSDHVAAAFFLETTAYQKIFTV